MKIAFDQQVFLLQEYGGISRYFCNLARELSLFPEVKSRIFAPLHFNRNIEPLVGVNYYGYRLPTLPSKVFRLVRAGSQLLAHRAVTKFKPDILHETYYSVDDFCPVGARRVTTIHDLIHEKYPEYFMNSGGTTRPKKISANRADHVICVSESTRRDAIEYLGVPENKTTVIYHGVDTAFLQTMDVSHKYDGRPFILYVGARGGYKNFDGLIKVLGRSAIFLQDFDLVCFGGGEISAAEIALIEKAGLGCDQIKHMGGGDDVLVSLYKQAVAFVYPSLYEGFGIPPLEAMAAGCPVICSNTSSLPEVVGDAAEDFNPLDEEAMLAAIENVLDSSSRRDALVEAGYNRCQLFSWQSCANSTLALYEEILS